MEFLKVNESEFLDSLKLNSLNDLHSLERCIIRSGSTGNFYFYRDVIVDCLIDDEEYFDFIDRFPYYDHGVTFRGNKFVYECGIPYFFYAEIEGKKYLYYTRGERYCIGADRNKNDIYYNCLDSLLDMYKLNINVEVDESDLYCEKYFFICNDLK